MSAHPPHAYGFAWRALRLAASAALIGWVVWSEIQNRNTDEWLNFWRCLPTSPRYSLLIVAAALAPLNWLLEALKWRGFFHSASRPTLARAYRAVVAGLAAALITPHRMGEYFGRIWTLAPSQRVPGLVAGALSSLCNQIAIGAAGMVGVWGMAQGVWDQWADPRMVRTIAAASLFGLIVLYLSLPRVLPCLLKFLAGRKLTPAIVKVLQKADLPASSRLHAGLGLAALRYAVYAGQLIALVCFFQLTESVVCLLLAVFSLFFTQTLLPLPALAGLAVRGALSLKLLGACGITPCACLASTYLLWILNLFLPALVGTFFLFFVKIEKSESHNDAP